MESLKLFQVIVSTFPKWHTVVGHMGNCSLTGKALWIVAENVLPVSLSQAPLCSVTEQEAND